MKNYLKFTLYDKSGLFVLFFIYILLYFIFNVRLLGGKLTQTIVSMIQLKYWAAF